MYEDIAVIISSISAVCSAGRLIFNGISNVMQSKGKYYEIMTDLNTEFEEIEKEYPNKENLQKDSKEVINYKRKFCGFHEKLAHMAEKKIVPKEII